MIVVGEDALEIEAGFGVVHQLHKKRVVRAGSLPPTLGVARPAVVTGQSRGNPSVHKIPHPGQIERAKTQVDVRAVDECVGIVGEAYPPGNLRAGGGDNLGQPLRGGKGARPSSKRLSWRMRL